MCLLITATLITNTTMDNNGRHPKGAANLVIYF